MKEEEKIAKLELNRYIYGKQLSKDDIVDSISILFNLIDSQQKEIENSINKDKIKEKIKELSKTQAYKVGLEEYTIKILQELLEE